MKYLVLFGDTFDHCTGTVDRLFDTHEDADLYCTAQNNAVHYVDNLDDKWRSEYWLVILPDDQGSPEAFAVRVLHAESTD